MAGITFAILFMALTLKMNNLDNSDKVKDPSVVVVIVGVWIVTFIMAFVCAFRMMPMMGT